MYLQLMSFSNHSFSIEQNHKALDIVKKGQSGAGVAIKLEGATQQLFGRHIDEKETLYSHITRHSIDTLKTPAMRDEVTKEEWALIVKLKTVWTPFRYLELIFVGFWFVSCIRWTGKDVITSLHYRSCMYTILHHSFGIPEFLVMVLHYYYLLKCL